jgi:hypothetical protein
MYAVINILKMSISTGFTIIVTNVLKINVIPLRNIVDNSCGDICVGSDIFKFINGSFNES